MQINESSSPLLEAAVLVSRVLASLAARSLAEVTDEVTMAQYRTLVILDSRGSQNLANLAEALGVTPATATRMCDRLVAKQLIIRQPQEEDRRHVHLEVTAKGRRLVSGVTAWRRRETRSIAGRLSAQEQASLSNALRRFSDVVDAAPEQDWSVGWDFR